MATVENGHASDGIVKSVELRSRPRKTNPFRWTFGLVVRCPSHLSELNESSPRVCKPYLVVRSHIEPYVLPYYDRYGAPYVEIARPYVQAVNEHIYTPAATVARRGYDQYGAPTLDQARAYGQQQWEAQVIPRLQNAKERAIGLYKSTVDPYVQHAKDVVFPYYNKVDGAVITVWDGYVFPVFARSRPFIGKTYTSGQNVLATTVLPYAQSTWSSVIYFANSALWPKLTGLYSENVEPQLVKIGQRLASYREGRRLRKVMDEADSSMDQQTQSAVASAEKSPVFESTVTTTATVGPVTHTTLSPAEQTAQAREKIASDLQTWQRRFATAVEKGSEDLEERVEEIVESYIRSGVNSHGESLITALETVVQDEISSVKLRINELAESLPGEEAPEQEGKVQDELLKEIRRAAISVRDRAHAVREWRNSFDQELTRRTSAAVNSTLDVLDSVRDLGLQEIGMRWAWMEGVTYKDWAKYHALKAQFEDWKNDIFNVGMQHVKVEEAKELANDILDRGMEVAEDAAKELARLKDVGRWKIAAREASDDFETRIGAPPPLPKRSKTDEESKSAEANIADTENHQSMEGSEQATSGTVLDSEGTAAHGKGDSENDLGFDDDIPLTHDKLSVSHDDSLPKHSRASDVSSAADGFSPASVPEADPSESVEPVKMALGVAAAESVPKQDASEHHVFPEQLHELVSQADDQFAKVTSAAGQAWSDGSVASLAHQVASSITSMAADVTPLAYISSVASSKLSEGLSLASAQLDRVRATATPTTAVEQNRILLDAQRRYYEAVGMAHDHYSAFVSSASRAVYGAPTPTGHLEQMASKASENWESLVSAASEHFYGSRSHHTPPALSDLVLQYEAIEQLVSELIVGKEPSFTEKALSRLHAIYETPYPVSALSAASSYVIGEHTATASAPFGSDTNVPSVENILHNANEQFQSAINAVSVQLYGTTKGPFEKATSSASSAMSAASAHISEAVYGTEPGYLEAAQEALEHAYASAESAIRNAVFQSASPTEAEQGAFASATSKLAEAVEGAQGQLANLASSASSLASAAVETVTSKVEVLTSDDDTPVKDEL
ncbi:hypothetical protein KXV58_008659 [Aspergillus fumigatus]|nr:hypothetical protein KXX31_003121 [Aspergillus fumigatus]KAH1820439.1 hypothetical protein KXX19_004874 [Aspergillus fumigatus]KAH1889315.1 hypothetical protein KXX01_004676 [Aspergillus fumigatus]KAH2206586.1 hypothetical protein KXV88_006455 [Aspergillus fumigatus]KAH2221973.1 hypothetical protein KXV58_008659 [Aspergillus fumigatus]